MRTYYCIILVVMLILDFYCYIGLTVFLFCLSFPLWLVDRRLID